MEDESCRVLYKIYLFCLDFCNSNLEFNHRLRLCSKFKFSLAMACLCLYLIFIWNTNLLFEFILYIDVKCQRMNKP